MPESQKARKRGVHEERQCECVAFPSSLQFRCMGNLTKRMNVWDSCIFNLEVNTMRIDWGRVRASCGRNSLRIDWRRVRAFCGRNSLRREKGTGGPSFYFFHWTKLSRFFTRSTTLYITRCMCGPVIGIFTDSLQHIERKCLSTERRPISSEGSRRCSLGSVVISTRSSRHCQAVGRAFKSDQLLGLVQLGHSRGTSRTT
mmetsp:Transcript_18541/g.37513  ORF Transcript_18541/g.37513 Transcript_18541/m.37513 type:complete len:200 (+) Transcript_18541:122-721(+)